MKKTVQGFGRPVAGRINRNRITVGADPEFELVNPIGEVVCADDVIHSGSGAEVEIGVDGAGSPAELRPKPGLPETVANNLRKLLRQFTRRFPNYRLSYSGNRYSVGGHIHVGIKDLHIDDFQARAIAKVLDDFLGRLVLPLSGAARQRNGYYCLSTYRIQPWGFEYRVPPASVFAHPYFARLCLKICRMVTFTCFDKKWFSYTLADNHQNEVTYNTPTLADYKKVCHFKEYEYRDFMEFISRLQHEGEAEKDMLNKWDVPMNTQARPERVRRPRTTINIYFSDDWLTSRRAALTQVLRETFHSLHRNVNIHLFGLREDRGHQTYGFHIEGYDIANLSTTIWNGTSLSLGVPWNLRMTDIGPAEFENLTAAIVAAYRNAIEER